MILKLDTPCIGVCSTVYGDKVCRGCKRRFEEVIDWNAYTEQQKQVVYQRLGRDMEFIVGQYLNVVDSDLLESALKNWSIRYREDQHPLSWALHLLRFADTKITTLPDVGIQALPSYAQLSYSELCNVIDKHLFEYSLSCTGSKGKDSSDHE